MWTTDKPYIVCKGGRGSFKSSVISLKLVTMMMKYIQQGKTVNVICIRENQQYLRDSVYNQILWAMDILHVSNEFKTRVSPMIIQHKLTGSTFYFYGANDPMKLKSNIVGNVIAVWFNKMDHTIKNSFNSVKLLAKKLADNTERSFYIKCLYAF
ncbi:MAG: terminase large subunit [Bacteriophage sp.]|nr:MAG: terminase large subunit [Bacteriophage sp.]UWG88671.1 MAG: terminase large subunit [Bacteriophage sp.]